MPSLIGSAPNQVPTNGMLGTMAFQDADNALVQNITVTGSSSVPTKEVTDDSSSVASTAFVRSFSAFKEDITTTTGTSSAYVLTPAIPVTSYSIGGRFQVKFHTTCSAAPTINISGVGAKPLVFQQADGNFTSAFSGDIVSGTTATIRYIPVVDVFEVIERRPSSSSEAASGVKSSSFITPSGLRSGLNASGSAPIYACRAWVNFNGTGTVAIRASGNVTSITDNGVGDYTVNFTTAMEDANYSVVGTCNLGIGEGNQGVCVNVHSTSVAGAATTKTTSACRVRVSIGNQAGGVDANDISLSFFR